MKTSSLLALAAGACSLAAVHLPFYKAQKLAHPTILVGSDRRSVVAGLAYTGATYAVNVTVGTPGQVVTLGLSTTSTKTWVVDARGAYCSSEEYDYSTDEYVTVVDEDCLRGTFSPGNSTSFSLTNPVISSSDTDYYGDEEDFTASTDDDTYYTSYVYGRNITDVISIGGATIPNLTMGLANDSYNLVNVGNKGVLGVGYNDSIGSSNNLPLRLVEQGLINTTAYSLWVNDDTASSGNLLFGAIDRTKFTGNLTRLSSTYSYNDMVVRVVGINGTTKNGGPFPINSTSGEDYYGSSGAGYSDYLFSATYGPPDTVSNLPTDIASQIWDMAGAYYQAEIEHALIGCSAASDSTTSLTIQLGGQGTDAPILTVYMSDLVIPASEYNVSEVYSLSTYSDLGDNVCLFGIQNGSSYSLSTQSTLGNTLLRRTYSVFDLANSEVALAPVVFGASATSNIVPFESYGATVPSSTLLCSYPYCSSSTGNNNGDSISSNSDVGSTAGSFPNVLSLGALLGLSLGLAVGCLVLGLAGFLIWRHRRNKKLATKNAPSVSSAEVGHPTVPTANAGHTGVSEMTQTARAPPPAEHAEAIGVDKGKSPEVPPPRSTGQFSEGQPESSRRAEERAIGDAGHRDHAV
ncbi:unnamed protein product [Discula destructiva]